MRSQGCSGAQMNMGWVILNIYKHFNIKGSDLFTLVYCMPITSQFYGALLLCVAAVRCCCTLLRCIAAVHCCGALLRCVAAVRCCGALLRCVAAVHCCCALLLCIAAVRCCCALLLCIVAVRCCCALLRYGALVGLHEITAADWTKYQKELSFFFETQCKGKALHTWWEFIYSKDSQVLWLAVPTVQLSIGCIAMYNILMYYWNDYWLFYIKCLHLLVV